MKGKKPPHTVSFYENNCISDYLFQGENTIPYTVSFYGKHGIPDTVSCYGKHRIPDTVSLLGIF